MIDIRCFIFGGALTHRTNKSPDAHQNQEKIMKKYIIVSLNEAKDSLIFFIKDDKNIAAIQEGAEIAITTLKNKNTVYKLRGWRVHE